MEVALERKGVKKDTDYLLVKVGENRYVIGETKEGGLSIHKTNYNGLDTLKIRPHSSNAIEIK